MLHKNYFLLRCESACNQYDFQSRGIIKEILNTLNGLVRDELLIGSWKHIVMTTWINGKEVLGCNIGVGIGMKYKKVYH